MSQKLPVDGFESKKRSKFNENFIKMYGGEGDIGNMLEVDIKYPKRLYSFRSDLPLLKY